MIQALYTSRRVGMAHRRRDRFLWAMPTLLIAAGCGSNPPAPPQVVNKAPENAATKSADRPKPTSVKPKPIEEAAKPEAQAKPGQASPDKTSPSSAVIKEQKQPADDKQTVAASKENGQGPIASSERLLLFTPAGPLVVDLKLSIDGQPYRAEREELVEDLLELADRNHDGRPTWEEVYADPKHVFARRLQMSNEQMDRVQFIKTHDTNQNGIVDAAEVRRFVSRSNNAGQAFSIDGSSRYRETNARHSLVRELLDADEDEQLSVAELAQAETRLRLRDANDDAIVTLAELDDTLAGDSQAMMTAMAYRNTPAAMRLGPLADWDGVIFTLAELYLRHGELPEEGFPLTPSLAADLDANGDGALSREEIERLDVIEPHVALNVRFGKSGDEPPGISVERLAPSLGAADDVAVASPGGVMLNLPGVRMRFEFVDRFQGAGGGPSPEEQLAALDADKNGYLEKKEVEDKSPGMAAMFDDWDANGDGMVYAREIASFERGRRAPQATAIRITANDDQDSLFPCLDADFDGRLSPRELRLAPERLSVLDVDGDEQLSLEEIPGGMTVAIERGATMDQAPRLYGAASAADAREVEGPQWFVFMDSNRDAEVSAREFPGSREKFDRLDADGDGFITASEAQAAGGAEETTPQEAK